MEITFKKEITANAVLLKVSAGARYWENATVNGKEDTDGDLIPCRNGDYWEPVIDINTGTIINWNIGTTADIHYKVCDDGTYTLYAEDGTSIIEKSGYVPEIMCPEEEGYGDYIIMKVDGNGVIANWKQSTNGFIEDED